jgi:hypothetical protein
MTPRSYAAVQRAYGRIHGAAAPVVSDEGSEQNRLFAQFSIAAAQQRATRENNGG